MIKEKIYPNYIQYYYYTEGDTVIYLKRYVGSKLVYSLPMQFDSSEEAQRYFDENCGA